MPQERLKALFGGYDETIRDIILQVLSKEQEHISMERPRVKEDIDLIITVVANQVLKRLEAEEAGGA